MKGAHEHDAAAQDREADDEAFLAYFVDDDVQPPSNSGVAQQNRSLPPMSAAKVEQNLHAANGVVRVGVDTFSTIWRLPLTGRPVEQGLHDLYSGNSKRFARNGIVVANSGTWLKSQQVLGQTLIAQYRGLTIGGEQSFWIEGRHHPNGVDDRQFLALPEHLLDWHDDAVALLDRLGFDPMRGPEASTDTLVDLAAPWPLEPRVRRVDLAADFHVPQESGGNLLAMFARMPEPPNTKRSIMTERIGGRSVVQTVRFFTRQGTVLRIYCKATESIQKRDRRRSSELAAKYGTWVRIEAQVARKGRDTFTIPALCEPGKAASLWAAHLGALLVSGAPCTHQEALQRVIAAAAAGGIKETARNALLGFVVADELEQNHSARVRRQRGAELASLGIGSLVREEGDVEATALLIEAIDAWTAWSALAPSEWRQRASQQEPVRSELSF